MQVSRFIYIYVFRFINTLDFLDYVYSRSPGPQILQVSSFLYIHTWFLCSYKLQVSRTIYTLGFQVHNTISLQVQIYSRFPGLYRKQDSRFIFTLSYQCSYTLQVSMFRYILQVSRFIYIIYSRYSGSDKLQVFRFRFTLIIQDKNILVVQRFQHAFQIKI